MIQRTHRPGQLSSVGGWGRSWQLSLCVRDRIGLASASRDITGPRGSAQSGCTLEASKCLLDSAETCFPNPISNCSRSVLAPELKLDTPNPGVQNPKLYDFRSLKMSLQRPCAVSFTRRHVTVRAYTWNPDLQAENRSNAQGEFSQSASVI